MKVTKKKKPLDPPSLEVAGTTPVDRGRTEQKINEKKRAFDTHTHTHKIIIIIKIKKKKDEEEEKAEEELHFGLESPK